MYQAEGSEAASGPWFEAVTEIAGQCVSPGGAPMFVRVSRAAVHKRIKEGRLTAFTYYVTHTSKGLFGKKRTARELPLVYIPVCELKLWANELEERMVRLGKITQEELEGEKPDWHGEFWNWHSKWQEERRQEK